MSKPLCYVFQELAEQTADQMRTAFGCQMPWSEETNTETILLTLKSRYPHAVSVTVFSKIQEKANGADWEFWFLDPTAGVGIPLRIQAKRVYPDTGVYGSLFYPKNTKSQMRTLIRQAQCDGMYPAYVLYTYLDDPSKAPALCNTLNPSGWDDMLGCLFASAKTVAAANSKRIEDLQHVCRPWHELVCRCMTSSIRVPGFPLTLPQIVHNSLRSFAASVPPGWVDDVSVASIDGDGDVPQPRKLPEYVQAMLSGDRSPERDELVFRQSRAFQRKIQGIVLISDPEEQPR